MIAAICLALDEPKAKHVLRSDRLAVARFEYSRTVDDGADDLALLARALELVKRGDETALARFAASLTTTEPDAIELQASDIWQAAVIVQGLALAVLSPTRERWARVRAASRSIAGVEEQDHLVADAAAALERALRRFRAVQDDETRQDIASATRLRLSRFDARFALATVAEIREALDLAKGGAPLRLALLTRRTGALGAALDRSGEDDGGIEQNRISKAISRSKSKFSPEPTDRSRAKSLKTRKKPRS